MQSIGIMCVSSQGGESYLCSTLHITIHYCLRKTLTTHSGTTTIFRQPAELLRMSTPQRPQGKVNEPRTVKFHFCCC